VTPAEGLALAAGLLKAIDVLIEKLAELGTETKDLLAATRAEATRIATQQAAYEAEALAAMGLAKGPTL
jgi:hypothetical protein